MCWYIGVKKEHDGELEVFKSPVAPSIFSHGRKYHEVRGPFETFVEARQRAFGPRVEREPLTQGASRVILRKKEV